MREIIWAVEWDQIIVEGDIELARQNFENTQLQAEMTCTSSSFVKTLKTLPPLNWPIKRAINHKKKTFSNYKKCKCTHHWNRFPRARNELRQLTRHFIHGYEDNLALNIKENQKKFWRYISAKDKTRQTIPAQL